MTGFLSKLNFSSLKNLLSQLSENPSSNPLQRACNVFLIASCDSKSCFENQLWFSQLFSKLAMNLCQRKSTNESKGKLEQKFDVAFETILELVSVSERSKTKLKQIFVTKTYDPIPFREFQAYFCQEFTTWPMLSTYSVSPQERGCTKNNIFKTYREKSSYEQNNIGRHCYWIRNG